MTDHAPQSRNVFVRCLYGCYAWSAFTVCALGAALAALALPGLKRRRHWAGACGRAFFRIAGIRTRVSGLEALPPGHCIVVANHASYLDGVILQAFLPPRFSYVIKSEMLRVPIAGFFLRRIGSRFVERFSTSASARDARNLLRAADSGESLAFFPEGTFLPEPGLGRFRGGAFATAIRSGAPLVPVVIAGSRAILPAGSMLPNRAPLHVQILAPIEPGDAAFGSHKTLAESARRSILTVLDEPDLLLAAEPAA